MNLSSRRFWFGLAVSLFFFGLLLWSVDLGKMTQSLQRANYAFVIPGLILYFIAVVFRALRWRILLIPLGNISLGRLFPVVVVGYMANNLLPVRLGELVRGYYLSQKSQISTSAAIGTIALERVFDGLSLLFFLSVVSILLPMAEVVRGLANHIGIGWPILVIMTTAPFILVLALMLILAYRPSWGLRLLIFVIKFLPDGVRRKVVRIAELFVEGLGALRDPRRLAKVFLFSLAVWIAEAMMYYAIGVSFALQDVLGGFVSMAPVILVVTATSNLATSLPASQGGIGPFEFVTVATLLVLGVDRDMAAAYAVALHVVLLVPVTILGFWYLWIGKHSLVKLIHGAEDSLVILPQEDIGGSNSKSGDLS